MEHSEYLSLMQSSAQIRGELRVELLSADFWGLLFDGSEDITKTTLQLGTDSAVRE